MTPRCHHRCPSKPRTGLVGYTRAADMQESRCHNDRIVRWRGGSRMTDENHGEQGEAVPLNWACTNCGYRVEGELPEKCSADKEQHVTPNATPVPTLTLTVSPR